MEDKNNRYQSLVVFLRMNGQHSMLHLLPPTSGDERVDCLFGSLNTALSVDDELLIGKDMSDNADDNALIVLQMLYHAIDDKHLLCFLKEAEKEPVIYSLGHDKVFKEAEMKAEAEKARASIGLYRKLRPYFERSGRYGEKVRYSNYPRTRALLLDIAIGRWAETKDESEAMSIFQFIVGDLYTMHSLSLYEHGELAIKTLRKNALKASADRLEVSIREVPGLKSIHDTLFVSWAEVLCARFSASTPLLSSLVQFRSALGMTPSNLACDTAISYVEKVGVIYKAVESFRHHCDLVLGIRTLSRVEYMDPEKGCVNISILVSEDKFDKDPWKSMADKIDRLGASWENPSFGTVVILVSIKRKTFDVETIPFQISIRGKGASSPSPSSGLIA